MSGKVTIATNLVGAMVRPLDSVVQNGMTALWPVNDPNLSGEHVATVRGVWTEAGQVKLLVATPGGTLFEVFAVNVKLAYRDGSAS